MLREGADAFRVPPHLTPVVPQVVYWVNTAGLSLSNRRLLSEVVEGLCARDLQDQGKPIQVRLKDMPP
jgi:hypothetical protein